MRVLKYIRNIYSEGIKNMKFCTHCGNELAEEAVICPKCGCAVADSNLNKPANGNNNGSYSTLSIVGFILSFFTSIVGLIISIMAYNAAKNEGDEKSKGFAKAGIIISSVSMGLVLVLVFIYLMIIFAALAAAGGYTYAVLCLI